MTFREDPVLDLYHDGIEPAESAQRGDHAETEARADRFNDFYDLAGWYALGAARAGNSRDSSTRGPNGPCRFPLGGRDHPSTEATS